MKVKRTYLEMFTFINVASNYIKNTPEETKLKKCVENVIKQCKPLVEDYNEKLSEINLKHCLVDEKTKKVLVNTEGGFEYTKEALSAKNKEVQELLKQEIVLHARVLPENNDLIETLDSTEKEVFSELVIDTFVDEIEKLFNEKD